MARTRLFKKQRKYQRRLAERSRAFKRIHCDLATTYILKTHSKLPKVIASIVFKMFLEAHSAEIRKNIHNIAWGAEIALQSDYYRNPVTHMYNFMMKFEGKRSATEKCQDCIQIMRYFCERLHLIYSGKERVYFYWIKKLSELSYRSVWGVELSEYFMARLPRQH